MVTYIVITLCILTLIAYLFDLSVKKTKVPGVILLMLLGIGLHLLADLFPVSIPDLKYVLRVLGTIGLLLIVLEASLDLELRKEKLPVIRNTLISAVVLLGITSTIFAVAISYFFGTPFTAAITNAVPLGIISSSVAISSVSHFEPARKEFVVYESSFSDIFGILLFNFFTFNTEFGIGALSGFFFQLLIILLLSAAASITLGMLLHKITHPVKIIPIITLLLLLYSLAEIFHLPSLILILVFGLFLNNIRLLTFKSFSNFFNKMVPASNERADESKGMLRSRWLSFKRIADPASIEKELAPFKQLVTEVTFIIRSFFFILFGYYLNLPSLLNIESLVWSLGITAFILISRALYFKVARFPFDAIVFVAPRGLITILLFLSINEANRVPQLNEGFLFQIILFTSFIMMMGLMNHRVETPVEEKPAPLAAEQAK